MITRLSEKHGASKPHDLRAAFVLETPLIAGPPVRVQMWIDGNHGRNLSWIYMGLVHIDISV
jgi:hypothetical protein